MASQPERRHARRVAPVGGARPEEILGVEPDADAADIHRAFLALARSTHPDAASDADPETRSRRQDDFIRISEAYRALLGRAAAFADPNATIPPTPGAAPSRAPAAAPASAASAPPGAASPASRRERVDEAIRLATARIAQGDAAGAVSELHEVLGLADEAGRRRVRLVLARAYLTVREWRRYGLSLLDELVSDDPRNADALALLGTFYHREGLVARADAMLRRALAADPGHVEARIHMRAVTDALRRRRAAPTPPRRRGLVARLLSIGR